MHQEKRLWDLVEAGQADTTLMKIKSRDSRGGLRHSTCPEGNDFIGTIGVGHLGRKSNCEPLGRVKKPFLANTNP